MALLDTFKQVFKDTLPTFKYAFAYGSAVRKQVGYDGAKMSKAMVDLMMVVPDTAKFHAVNLEFNPGHYSMLMRNVGLSMLQRVQNAGAGVYFNTDVDFGERKAKYGVVSMEDMLTDIMKWKTLYVAGRLHKPVLELVPFEHEFSGGLHVNRVFAVNTALLMLPETFSTAELFEKIVSLSYLGDVRSGIAENPNKVKNIVAGQLDELLVYYDEAIKACLRTNSNEVYFRTAMASNIKPGVILRKISQDRWQQDTDPRIQKLRLIASPLPKKNSLVNSRNIEKYIKIKTWWPSVVQSAKGLLTANPDIALKYFAEKVSKRLT